MKIESVLSEVFLRLSFLLYLNSLCLKDNEYETLQRRPFQLPVVPKHQLYNAGIFGFEKFVYLFALFFSDTNYELP